jgi:FdhE protein
MPQKGLRSQVSDRIEKAIATTEAELPALTNLLEAFKELSIETAVLKAELSEREPMALPEVDKDAFRQGVPFADMEMFCVNGDDLRLAQDRIGPAIRKGFPKLDAAVTALSTGLKNGAIDAEAVIRSLLKDNRELLEQTATAIEADAEVMRFILGRFVKPFVEARAELMARHIEGLEWNRGYCPVCGSWPSLSIIREQEGQRWLMCSLCSHQWRFMRLQCPFCDNQDAERMEMVFSEGRESERAEVCHVCRKYLVGIDARDRVDDPVMEVVPLMLVYLDLLAQGEGFAPGAVTDWNVLDR